MQKQTTTELQILLDNKGEIVITPFQGLARAAYSNSLGVAQRY